MPLIKHGASWVVLTLLVTILLGCTPGPVDPVQQYGDISGYIRASGSHKAIPGALVICAEQTYNVSRSGIYIFKEIPEGYHMLTVEKSGFDKYTALIHVLDNTVHNVYMTKLVEYRDISGQVYLDNSSIPVPDAVVVCGNVYDTTATDGSFHLPNILVDTHRLFVFKNHYVSYESRITLESDTTVDVFMASAPLSGVVTHRMDGAVVDVRIEVAEAVTYSSGNGSYRLPAAPQGTHTVVISHPDYDSLTHQITVVAAENRLDPILTRSICDTLPVVEDASICNSDLDGCLDCPAWGNADDNFGDSELLKLEYFLRSEIGPPQVTYDARTRFLIGLPALPENADHDNMSSVKLVLYPAGEQTRTEYVSVRMVRQDGPDWTENSVTWSDGPEYFSLPFTAISIQPGQQLEVEVMPLYDSSNPQPGLLLQKEELGEADPPQRLVFWSSEAAAENQRPVVIVRYSY
ncbi:MAG: carboxypeptidase regulatory-like domain-containing protein [candidate division Zixibacteria bacterium]|nr:carboxypeptidase regulatory-like domain-containing protein [candidate division Zixibacteria bacterium]